MPDGHPGRTPADTDYECLLELRITLRRFLRWSERQAKAAGLTASQHQLLLAVRGHRGDQAPSVGDVAEHLLLHSNSAVGLVDRAARSGLVRRVPDPEDRRVTRLALTARGTRVLEDLSAKHLTQWNELAPRLTELLTHCRVQPPR